MNASGGVESATATNGAAGGSTPKPVSPKSSDLEVVNAAGEVACMALPPLYIGRQD